MPHDAKGIQLKVGDKVAIYGRVNQIHFGEDYCNCSVELDHPMPPTDTPHIVYALNTRQLEKIPVEGEQ